MRRGRVAGTDSVINSLGVDLAVIFGAILVLVSIANRLGIAYPIVLVLGGIVIGYIPGIPPFALPPDLVLVLFLPPLLYWESVTAPTSEFFTASGLWWMFQLAFGLVVVTTLAVGAVAHALNPNLAWGAALVLGAIVSSTDEVAFAPVIERIPIPRHVVATIEGESLVNDATSLILYGIAVTAVVSGAFSIKVALGSLVLSILSAIAIGAAAGLFATVAWRLTQDDALQPVISLMTPYLAYLPSRSLGVSAVLAVVTAGLITGQTSPLYMTPRARERVRGFWVTIVFMVNAFIFVAIGMQFHQIVSELHVLSWVQLLWYAVAVSCTVIVVRLAWVFLQALLPATNEPEHATGKADWSHVTVLGWAGIRGGISLAAALAIPLETAAGPFPERNLIIFLTFCVLIATLIIQGGTLPLILRWMNVRDDGVDAREERVALAHTAKAALKRLDEMERAGEVPPELLTILRRRFSNRWREFSTKDGNGDAARDSDRYRQLVRDLLGVQRRSLFALRQNGKVDNTVLRRIQRLLDLEAEQVDLLESTGRSDIDDSE